MEELKIYKQIKDYRTNLYKKISKCKEGLDYSLSCNNYKSCFSLQTRIKTYETELKQVNFIIKDNEY